MLTETERRTALAEIARIEDAKSEISDQLKIERRAAIIRNDPEGARNATIERGKLGRAHIRLLNAKRSVNVSTTTAGAITRLNALADDADTALNNLGNLAKALRSASDLIRILGKLAGAFV